MLYDPMKDVVFMECMMSVKNEVKTHLNGRNEAPMVVG